MIPCDRPAQPPRGHSGRWCRTGGCCTGPPRWTDGSECLSPSVPVTTQSDSPGHPPHIPVWAAWCLWEEENKYKLNIKKKRGKDLCCVTDTLITYVGHKIQTYRGTRTTGRHLPCLWLDPEWWWVWHNELQGGTRDKSVKGIQKRSWIKKKCPTFHLGYRLVTVRAFISPSWQTQRLSVKHGFWMINDVGVFVLHACLLKLTCCQMPQVH